MVKLPQHISDALKFSAPLFLALVFTWGYQVGFRFLALPIVGANEFAVFTVGYSLSSLLFFRRRPNSYLILFADILSTGV